jgi:hypothetical protein
MLTVTNNGANDILTIESDLIDTYISNLPTPLTGLELTVKVNCETEFVFTLDDTTITIADNAFYIIPADLNQDTVFDNQVISFSLVETTLADSSTETQTDCLFIDKDLKCQILDYISTNISTNSIDNILLAQSLYSSLLNSEDCSDCDCEDACIIFEYLTSLITGSTSITSNCANCN